MSRLSRTQARWLWRLRPADCTGCGICADVCNDEAIAMSRDQAQPVAVPGACVGCMECVRECPTLAIDVVESGRETSCRQPLP